VQQWADNGQSNQQWRPEQVSSGVYKLVARHSGKALDVAGQSVADGANVQQWADNSQSNQQWQLVQVN
jgi:mannan endo-1,4-beta-mannosidase